MPKRCVDHAVCQILAQRRRTFSAARALLAIKPSHYNGLVRKISRRGILHSTLDDELL